MNRDLLSNPSHPALGASGRIKTKRAAALPQFRAHHARCWPAGRREKIQSKSEFIERVQKEFVPDPMGDAEEAVRAVLALLTDKISVGEMHDVRHDLPEEIRDLFPA